MKAIDIDEERSRKKELEMKKALVDAFISLEKLEARARDLYTGLIDKLDNAEWKELITGIRDDEIRHVNMAKQLQDIVRNNELMPTKLGRI